MGGLYVLLAVATMGVTYGWQPDGRGGVEYIVQVSPDDLAQVRHTGEITSTIDPSIRGHVSRVVVRVGTGQLPRQTPASILATHSSVPVVADADRMHVGVPQMPGSERVMKPDPQQGGLDLPPSLADRAAELARRGTSNAANSASNMLSNAKSAATQRSRELAGRAADRISQGARNTAGAAGDAIGRLSNQLSNDVRNALPGRRPANDLRTGSVGDARDERWGPLDEQQAAASSRQTQDLMGPPSPFTRDRAATNASLANRRNDDQRMANDRSLGSTRNFGSVPNSASSQRSLTTGGRSTELNYANNQLPLNSPSTRRDARDPFGDSRLNDVSLRDRQTQQSNLNSRIPAANRTPAASAAGRLPAWDPNYRTAASSSVASTAAPATNTAAERLREFNSRYPASQSTGASDIQVAQPRRLPPGGYTFDSYGNPVNRQGEIIDERGYPVTRQRAYELTTGRNNVAFSNLPANLPTAPPNVLASNQNNPAVRGNAAPPSYPAPNVAMTTAPNYYPASQNQMSPYPNGQRTAANYRQTNSPRTTEPASASDTRERESTTSGKRETLAAQPLFNSLLLMSIVGNIYLIVWLKNLRHQFHDLVASKRIANASNGINSMAA